jgi:hypothetical protein
MARTVNQLTATKVHKLKTLGMYPDGAGLYLQVWREREILAVSVFTPGKGPRNEAGLAPQD